MKRIKFKKGDRVRDKWWPEVEGVVHKVLKTRLHIKMSKWRYTDRSPFFIVYDKSHFQFLEKVK